MQAAHGSRARRQGHVDALGREPRLERGRLQPAFAGLDGGGKRLLNPVQSLTRLAPRLGLQTAQGLHALGDQPLLAQGFHPQAFQGAKISRRGNAFGQLAFELRKFVHDVTGRP